MSWCLSCCGVFGPRGDQDRLQSTLLIQPEAPCVAEAGVRTRQMESSSDLSFSSLDAVSPESPQLVMMRTQREKELVDMEEEEVEDMEEDEDEERRASGDKSGESSSEESSHLLGRRGAKDSQATSSSTGGGGSQRGRTSKARRRERRREKQRRRGRGEGANQPREGEEEEDLKAEKEAALKRFKTQSLDECPICLEEFSQDSPAVFLNCGHAFHLHCVYEWLERSSTCAVCGMAVEDYEVHEGPVG
ncbi:RING-type domain-containing protein [Chloropicon primus]|uniref:RING-type E3 ubiquitin transferase n=1 Tax=Chloropicon primus TaxID=1764295 RepID=A0A5B8MQW1_9CHLO|nr:hypothetical protein A3770_09p53840 [Chloropicon primus]UPR02090.1 RING-type domain-containing protein [Chloropicon primus]|eukprot:QDZ22866.1 hypothetical protein A3770_09p53840 [Chloropicon primus]